RLANDQSRSRRESLFTAQGNQRDQRHVAEGGVDDEAWWGSDIGPTRSQRRDVCLEWWSGRCARRRHGQGDMGLLITSDCPRSSTTAERRRSTRGTWRSRPWRSTGWTGRVGARRWLLAR